MKVIQKIAALIKTITIGIVLLSSAKVFADEKISHIQKTVPHSSPEQMIKMVLGLLLVLVLIFFLAWLFKKFIGVGLISNAKLRAVAGISVGQKERVVLVQVGERQILVGVSPGQVNMLHALEKGEEISFSEKSGDTGFSEKLKQSLSRLEKK